MSKTSSTPKRRTITLTSHRPVTIDEAEWPVIATASGDSWTGNDPALHQQASMQDELDEYTLRVRRHTDGRHIVYGTHTRDRFSSASPNARDRAGYLLDTEKANQALETFILLVAQELDLPQQMITDCINSLPPTEL
jgi:hypothetical protein